MEELAPGHTLAALEACLGVPKTSSPAPAVTIAEWDFTPKPSTGVNAIISAVTTPVTLPLSLIGDLTSPSQQPTCRATAQATDGDVTLFALSGNTAGLTGPNQECQPLTRGCLRAWKGPSIWR